MARSRRPLAPITKCERATERPPTWSLAITSRRYSSPPRLTLASVRSMPRAFHSARACATAAVRVGNPPMRRVCAAFDQVAAASLGHRRSSMVVVRAQAADRIPGRHTCPRDRPSRPTVPSTRRCRAPDRRRCSVRSWSRSWRRSPAVRTRTRPPLRQTCRIGQHWRHTPHRRRPIESRKLYLDPYLLNDRTKCRARRQQHHLRRRRPVPRLAMRFLRCHSACTPPTGLGRARLRYSGKPCNRAELFSVSAPTRAGHA